MQIMKPESGTYALVLRSLESARAQIGRWGRLDIEPGFYIYVGSAFGPGGVRARILRHCRKTKPKHWHMDYLREHVVPISAWYCYAPVTLEHQWAKGLSEMAEMLPVKGFGCADCKCRAHLFVSRTKLALARFTNAVGSQAETWIYQPESYMYDRGISINGIEGSRRADLWK